MLLQVKRKLSQAPLEHLSLIECDNHSVSINNKRLKILADIEDDKNLIFCRVRTVYPKTLKADLHNLSLSESSQHKTFETSNSIEIIGLKQSRDLEPLLIASRLNENETRESPIVLDEYIINTEKSIDASCSIGTVTWSVDYDPDVFIDESYSEESEIDEDCDSNAEDYFANDYPEDESCNSSSDCDSFDFRFRGRASSEESDLEFEY